MNQKDEEANDKCTIGLFLGRGSVTLAAISCGMIGWIGGAIIMSLLKNIASPTTMGLMPLGAAFIGMIIGFLYERRRQSQDE